MNRLIFLIIFLALNAAVAVAQNKSENTIIKIGEKNYYIHTIVSGETVSSISRRYNVLPRDIVDENPMAIEILRPGQMLKIPVQPASKYMTRRAIRRNFIEHTIAAGETLYAIAKKYDISISDLMADNEEADPVTLGIGKKLLIRRKNIGSSDSHSLDREIAQYSKHLDNFSDHHLHHVVKSKETIYGLSRQYGITEERFLELNPEVANDGLKIGAIVKLPKTSEITEKKIEPKNHIESEQSVQSENVDDQQEFTFSNPQSSEDNAFRIALMLPMTTNGKTNSSFVDFYRGVLIALDELRHDNMNISVTIVDTEKSASKVLHTLSHPEFESVNLFIGPVYDDTFEVAATFAMRHNIPIVSPLAQVSTQLPNVFQIAPNVSERTKLLSHYLQTDRNIIVIRPDKNLDSEFASEILPLLPENTTTIEYHDDTEITVFDESLSTEKDNLIITLSTDETLTEEILARISSSQNNISARGNNVPRIHVLGSSRLSRFVNIDKELYFKLNVTYPTNYHVDRSNPKVVAFDKLFIEKFNTLPTPFAYRGYDVTMLFLTNLDGNIAENITMGRFSFLQMPYNFTRTSTGKFENNCWQLIHYKNDYTIELTGM